MKDKINISIRKNVIDAILNKISDDEIDEIDEILEDMLIQYFNISILELNQNLKNQKEFVETEEGLYEEADNLEQNYIYIFLDPRIPNKNDFGTGFDFSFLPFYVGKGGEYRINQNGRNKKVNERIDEIEKSGQKIIKLKLYSKISKFESIKIENNLIYKIGRKDLGLGPLLNLTGGKNFIDENVFCPPINLENQFNKLLIKTLNEEGRINKTAKKLGLSCRTLYRKIKSIGIKKVNGEFKISD